jgi:ribonuclease III
MKVQRDLPTLQATIGYRFKDTALLELALTHVSSIRGGDVHAQSYQRLEFLGDRVLGLVMAEMLCAAFPKADEGELARRMAELVRRESCAEVAVAWDIGPNIRLGTGEVQTGGRKRQTILADVCEAVIGAVFLDGGYASARLIIEAAWTARMHNPAGDRRDAKTLLQEITQGRQLGMPVYTEVSRTGPAHRTVFVVAVAVPVMGEAQGTGTSKREAEQAAATALLATITAQSGGDTP